MDVLEQNKKIRECIRDNKVLTGKLKRLSDKEDPTQMSRDSMKTFNKIFSDYLENNVISEGETPIMNFFLELAEMSNSLSNIDLQFIKDMSDKNLNNVEKNKIHEILVKLQKKDNVYNIMIPSLKYHFGLTINNSSDLDNLLVLKSKVMDKNNKMLLSYVARLKFKRQRMESTLDSKVLKTDINVSASDNYQTLVDRFTKVYL